MQTVHTNSHITALSELAAKKIIYMKERLDRFKDGHQKASEVAFHVSN